ncbi:plasmid replication initiator protein [Streptomyces sp. H10-C2]|uniref:replication initiator n=1 Tax=unclassified Streptomyces TaxID=2593676 RepID=UPI0024BAA947|nr:MULTISPECIES: replication initiator [unclassified Streptomyces]MDJ0341388.1 plasmid replication initiator protein [Streptomyces sp. PH10-H1]MDJ0370983.1 plasmid replication initiator protein [Streptomyces sp. H10-C2]
MYGYSVSDAVARCTNAATAPVQPPGSTRSDRHGHNPPKPVHPCRYGGPPWEAPTITASGGSFTTPADRRAALDRAARLRQLSETDRDIIALAHDPLFGRWLEQVTATGGCTHPVYLTGSTTTRDAGTGEVLHHYDTSGEPGERLMVRCRNRRQTVCAPCSRLHAGDTFHLVRAGLIGGKSVPAEVRDRPRLFVTLTAPSFGPVHRATDGQRCRPRRDGGDCEHGRPIGCGLVHTVPDPSAGQPLCRDCYDYTAHVLWHAHAGELWARFTRAVRRHLASAAGLAQSTFPAHARLSFAKVAEYQHRAAIHVHAVVRLDGPGGPHDPPPVWGTTDRLTAAVQSAAHRIRLRTAYGLALGEHELRWGSQLDARPLRALSGGEGLADDAVAAYVAKYVTKGAADTSAGLDHAVTSAAEIEFAPVTAHLRTLMRTCWRLGGLREFEPLRLRAWAHTLGYRGHILTKSRAYSTTYAALRADRAQHERAGSDLTDASDVTTDARWRYSGSGHTPGAALIAAGIAEDLTTNRRIAREEISRSAMDR